MKKDKEWLKKEIESDGVQLEYLYANYYTDDKAIMIDDVRHLIDQLDEPEQVVVPQFVDKWLKRRKKDFESANIAMMYINACGWDDETHIEYKLYKWIPENTIAFCEAWEHGYTIEHPKMLTVIVKDYDKTIMSKQLPEDEVNKMVEEW